MEAKTEKQIEKKNTKTRKHQTVYYVYYSVY